MDGFQFTLQLAGLDISGACHAPCVCRGKGLRVRFIQLGKLRTVLPHVRFRVHILRIDFGGPAGTSRNGQHAQAQDRFFHGLPVM